MLQELYITFTVNRMQINIGLNDKEKNGCLMLEKDFLVELYNFNRTIILLTVQNLLKIGLRNVTISR